MTEKERMAEYKENLETIWELIEVLTALHQIWPGYFNDAADVDREGCFVSEH